MVIKKAFVSIVSEIRLAFGHRQNRPMLNNSKESNCTLEDSRKNSIEKSISLPILPCEERE